MIPPPAPWIDLKLDGNEGLAAPAEVVAKLAALSREKLRRYPDARRLEALLAARFGLAPEQVAVCAGADEALDRICRAWLARGREVVLPVPTFEMLERYVRLAGATVREIPWLRGAFPRAAVRAAIGARTALIVVVSPNNPTGLAATAADLRALARAAPRALLLVDAAYAEFADEDLTSAALALPNALVVRTFSKGLGLAGLRVGYVLGPAELLRALRVGPPFPVATPSLALAAARLAAGPRDLAAKVRRIRSEADALVEVLRRLGASAERSQGNFVLGRFRAAAFVRDSLSSLGIAVRAWPQRHHLENALRITLPGNAPRFARLRRAIETALAPQALLLDLDERLAPTNLKTSAVERAWLERIERRMPLGIFRARLGRSGAAALRRLGAERAWCIVASPERVAAARAAGVVPIGIARTGASNADRALRDAGAACVLATLAEITPLLP